MTTVSCPRCHDDVTAPGNASLDTVVRCPLCGEEYALSEAMANAPPALTIVAPGELSLTDDLPLKDRLDAPQAVAMESARPFVFEERPAPRRPIPRAKPRRPQQTKNPVKEVLKIVAGGVVGLTLGQLVLWWMPGQWGPSQRDPVRLGQRIGRYVPFLVPAIVRGESADTVDLGEMPATEMPAPSGSSESDRSQERFRQFSDRSAASADPTSARKRIDPGLAAGDESRDPNGAASSVEREASATLPGEPDSPRVDSGGSSSLTRPRVGTGIPASSAGGVRDAPRVSAERVGAMLAASRLLWEQTAEADRPAEIAASLAEIAHDVTFIDTEDPDAMGAGEAVRSWIAEITSSAEGAAALADAVANPDNVPPRPLVGQMLLGNVVSKEKIGQIFETRLTLDGDRQVVVLSALDPGTAYDVGDQVVLLGVLLTDPDKQLIAYRGKAKRATFGGLAIKRATE